MNFSIIRICVCQENEFVLYVDLNKLKNGYLTLRRKCNLAEHDRRDESHKGKIGICYLCFLQDKEEEMRAANR